MRGDRPHSSIRQAIALALAISVPAGCGNAAPPATRLTSPAETTYVPRAARAVPAVTTSPEFPAPSESGTGPSSSAGFWVVDLTNVDEGMNDAIQLTITQARMGVLSAQTAPNASCVASGYLPSGGPIPATLGSKRATPDGAVTWSFATATNERGTGSYTLTCSAGASLRTVNVFFFVP